MDRRKASDEKVVDLPTKPRSKNIRNVFRKRPKKDEKSPDRQNQDINKKIDLTLIIIDFN